MPDCELVIENGATRPQERGLAREPEWPRDVTFCSRNAVGREALEAFVQGAFRRQHGATVRSFLPVLIGLRNPPGALIGVAGYRPAARETLYLERYLAEPVEACISRRIGANVTRAEVAEIGNFACSDCRTALAMVGVLAQFLRDQDQRWVVFTATRTVRGIMRHLGVTLRDLGRADAARARVTGDEWGRYYSTNPRVMLGDVRSWHGLRSGATAIKAA